MEMVRRRMKVRIIIQTKAAGSIQTKILIDRKQVPFYRFTGSLML
jgi:hypothetical protein